jgi:hypothetical protein
MRLLSSIIFRDILTATPVGQAILSPAGLGNVGQAILPAAAFQAAIRDVEWTPWSAGRCPRRPLIQPCDS